MPNETKKKRAVASGKRSAAPKFLDNLRGVKSWKEAAAWLQWRGIEDIECITPDLAGVPRGKMMPSSKFTSNTSLSLPSSLSGKQSRVSTLKRPAISAMMRRMAT